jgi:hypothetical protein
MSKSKIVQTPVAGNHRKDMLVAVAAVITAIATILTAVIGPEGFVEALVQVRGAKPTPALELPTVPATATAVPCLYFADLPEDMVVGNVELEEEISLPLLPDQAADMRVAIRLFDSQSLTFLGGLKFSYVESRKEFEVLTVMNGRCEELLDFSQTYLIKSGEIFTLTIDNQEYALQFVAIADQIKINFTTKASS